jgi:hypothetical protein
MNYLYSDELEARIYEPKVFNKEEALQVIKDELKARPTDTLTWYKVMNNRSFDQIISFYEVNPKTSEPCKVITRGYHTFYRPLSV